MFDELQLIHDIPAPFEFYTAETLWDDEHLSRQMLQFHLNPDLEPASRCHEFIRTSIDWLTTHFNLGPGSRIADFGCGPGLYSLPLAQRGADVTGIDVSRRSIAYARQQAADHGLAIDYVRQNYLDYASDKRFDLIILIYCDFCALSPAQRQQLLQRFHRQLSDEGVVMLDVFTLSALAKRHEHMRVERQLMGGFWSEQDYFGFHKAITYPQQKVFLDHYYIVEAQRQWQVYNWLQYFSREALEREFADNGLQIRQWYGDVAGAPYDAHSDVMAVMATKR